jgi:hypothetical protein
MKKNYYVNQLYTVNATFNNISVISWRYVLLVEEIGEPGENNQPVSQVSDKLYPMMLYTTPWAGFELISLEIDGHFPEWVSVLGRTKIQPI